MRFNPLINLSKEFNWTETVAFAAVRLSTGVTAREAASNLSLIIAMAKKHLWGHKKSRAQLII